MHHCKPLLLLCGALCLSSACSPDPKLKRLESELTSARNQRELNVKSHKLKCYLDDELKGLEERIEKELEGAALDLFRKSAAAWRVYLGQEVAFEARGFEGGTIQPLMAKSAAIRLIGERTRALSEKDPQGGK